MCSPFVSSENCFHISFSRSIVHYFVVLISRMKLTTTMIRMGWIFVGPLVLSPLLFLGMEFRCAFCIVLLSSFWIVEVVPIGITSLLPIFLFPLLGIQSAKDISLVYFKASN
uniref:Ovule protein n=1 Tax=Heterorhabditis bacteriophora TaxID=37862 RepID=A0A1I7W6R4_HETBA